MNTRFAALLIGLLLFAALVLPVDNVRAAGVARNAVYDMESFASQTENTPSVEEEATGTVSVDDNSETQEEVDQATDAEEESKEEEYSNPDFLRLKDKRLRMLPGAEKGRIEYLRRDKFNNNIKAMAIMNIDPDGSPGIFLLTTSSMEVFQFSEGGKMERVWEGKFVKEFPSRGFAAAVYPGKHKGTDLLFVSINVFGKSFAYTWENGRIQQAGRVNGDFVDSRPSQSLNMMSVFGDGVISYSGSDTHFVDLSGDEPERHNFPLLEDYYSGCILRWMDVSVDLARVAVVTDHGMIKVFQGPGKLKARTETPYGGKIRCRVTPQDEFLIVSTESGTDDALVVLKIKENVIEETWRTPPMGGAITTFTAKDLDGDGEPEIYGVLDPHNGNELIFRILPDYSDPENIDAPDAEIDQQEVNEESNEQE